MGNCDPLDTRLDLSELLAPIPLTPGLGRISNKTWGDTEEKQVSSPGKNKGREEDEAGLGNRLKKASVCLRFIFLRTM